MKEYKEPIVREVEFNANDIINTSGGPDTQGEIGGNLLGGGSTPAKSAASTNLGIGGSQQ